MRTALAFVLALVLTTDVLGRQDWRTLAVASFDEVWQTVSDTFYDPSFGGLNWAAVKTELRPRVQAADTAATARQVIREMLSRLKRSHFLLLTSSVDSQTLPGDATVPIEIRVIPAGIIITRVDVATDDLGRLRPGDRIVAIDGDDARGWIASAEGFDERAKRLAVWQRTVRVLHGPAGSMTRLTVVDPAGRERTVEVVRLQEPGETVALGNLPPLQVRVATREVRTPASKRVGVTAFNTWMTAVAEPFAIAVDTYRSAAGFVVDLRGNPGGLAEMMRGIAGHFLPTPELIGRVHMRNAELEFRANPRRSTTDGRRVEPFAGPVAILVDELTASASECFAGGLQSLGRARVFGTQTRGQALPASTRQLPNGDVLMYAIGDFVTSTGRRLENEGVAPDEAVPLAVTALAEGRDLVLEAALAWIDRQGVRLP